MERITHNNTLEGLHDRFSSGSSLCHFPAAHGIPVNIMKDQKNSVEFGRSP